MVVRGPGQEEKIRQTPRAKGGEGARSAAPEARPSLTGGSVVCRWRVPGYGLLPWTASLQGEDWRGWVPLRVKWPATPEKAPHLPGSRAQSGDTLLGSKREQIMPERPLHHSVCCLP